MRLKAKSKVFVLSSHQLNSATNSKCIRYSPHPVLPEYVAGLLGLCTRDLSSPYPLLSAMGVECI